MNSIRPLVFIAFLTLSFSTVSAQYTETINSNRPGQSQGAYAVGTKVIQVETGVTTGSDDHTLLNTERDIFGYDLFARYGFLKEALELNFQLRYESQDVLFTNGNVAPFKERGLRDVVIGGKYLFFDPTKSVKEDAPNLYSYHANFKFKWKTLIPAISAYVGARFDFTNSPFTAPEQDGVSPVAAIITQNNWGRWVWVNNIIADRITTDFPSYTWITTMTHSFSGRFAAFLEYQLIKSDFYADNIARGGLAYLITPDLQVDVSGLVNFKDTPKRNNLAFGISYRLDLHDTDERIYDKDPEDPNKKEEGNVLKEKKKRKKKKTDFDDDGLN